jgi:long-chain acyl-CoA synthetase
MNYSSLAEMFFQTCNKFSDKVALMYKDEGSYKSVLFNEVRKEVQNLAGGIASLGVQKGDKVVILSENRKEWSFFDYATLINGAASVPIYSTLLPRQIKFIINNSDAKVVVVSNREQLEKVKEVEAELPKVEKIIVIDSGGVEHPKMVTYKELIEQGKKYLSKNNNLIEKSVSGLTRNDLATIIYTSGTTGVPKGVMLTHGNFLANIEGGLQAIPVSEADSFLSFLPLSHVFERMVGHFLAFQIGATIAYAENVDTVAENLKEVKPTIMASVPRLFEKIYGRIIDSLEEGSPLKKKLFFWAIGVGKKVTEHKQQNIPLPNGLRLKYSIATKLVFSKLHERVGGRIRFFVSGGAPLSKEIGEFFTAAGLLILEGYGLTETSPVITVNLLDKFRFGAVGFPLNNVEVKIAEDGEILTKGPHVMKGYYKDEESTKEAIDSAGWFHTGDIGHIDEDGMLVITDRKKNIIVTAGGKNIAPQYIENLLVTSRYIEQALVIGDKRKYCSALIVPNMETIKKYAEEKGLIDIPDQELINNPEILKLIEGEVATVSKELASYETIKKFTLIDHLFTIESGELTPTLKVKRNVVEQRYKDIINELYTEA